MPAKVHPYWERRVISLKENNSDWGAGRIAAAIQREEPPQHEAVGDPGSERWVGGILRNVWAMMKEDQLREYRHFYWPESMKRGDLPWEASAAALELLMFLDYNGVRARPSVLLVKWYWRVRAASPDMSRGVSFDIAVGLTRQEENGEPPGLRGAEWHMAYHHVPQVEGRDDPLEERKKRYREARDREDDPIPPYYAGGLSISMTEETDPEFWIDLLFASIGATQANRCRSQEEIDSLIEEYNPEKKDGEKQT